MNPKDITKAVLLRCRGCPYKKIAETLGWSVQTIRYHLDEGYRNKRKAKSRLWRERNRDTCLDSKRRSYRKNREKYQQWYRENRELVSENKRRWRERNPKKVREYYHERVKHDVQYKLSILLRNRLRDTLKNLRKTGSAVRDLGCSVDELRTWLELQFKPGMTWGNHGEWHIDHVRPLASFDLTNRDQLLEACHFTNLQPLWEKENLRKGAKAA